MENNLNKTKLNHFAVNLKLIQCRKSTILQLKKRISKIENRLIKIVQSEQQKEK